MAKPTNKNTKSKNPVVPSKNQTAATKQAGTKRPRDIVVTPGVYDVPGGKLYINEKGLTRYEGTPYTVAPLKKKYRDGPSDRNADGKVMERMGKKK